MTSRRRLDPIDLVLDGLAVHRLTRLATADVITDDIREAIIRDAYRRAGGPKDPALPTPDVPGIIQTWQETVELDDHPPKVATLVTCRWCASVHCAMMALCMKRLTPRTWNVVRGVLALSTVATLLSGLEDD